MKKGYIIAIFAIAGVIGLSKAIYSSQNINTARAGSAGGRSTGGRGRSFSGGGRSFSPGGRRSSLSGSRSFSGAGAHRTTHISRTAGATSTRSGINRTGAARITGTRAAGTRTRLAGTRTTAGRTRIAGTGSRVAGAHRWSRNDYRGWRSGRWHNRNAFIGSNWGLGFNSWWGGWGYSPWVWDSYWGLPYVTTLPSCAYVYNEANNIYYCDGYYFAPYGDYYYVSPQPTFGFGIGIGF